MTKGSIVFLTLLSISSIISYECPDVFRWGKTPDINTCIAYDPSSSTDQTVVYNVNSCPDKNHYCMFNIGLYDRVDTECKEKNTSKELLDGMTCKTNSQCFTKVCEAGKCKGKAKGQQCFNTMECQIGFACIDRHCDNLIPIGKQCNQHYDCVLGAYCNPMKLCQEIYSLNDGEESSKFQFCKSGETAQVGGRSTCVSLTLKDKDGECIGDQKDCTYDVRGKKGQYVGQIKYDCLCSHAYPNRKFCPIPLNSAVPQKFIKKLKEMRGVHSYNREILKTAEDRALAFRALAEFKGLDERILSMIVELPYTHFDSEIEVLIEEARNAFFLQ